MYVETLVLEVGRLCNMECPHCLRGCKQNIAMPFEIAKCAIDSFEHIGSITFTGGEPMLYADSICEIIDYIINQKKKVGGFYIASNGLLIVPKLMYKLAEFYAYIMSTEGDYEEDWNCCFDLSLDQYHDEIPEYNKAFVKAFKFAGTRGDIYEGAIINQGNAVDNGLGLRNHDVKLEFAVEDDMTEMVYVNAKGFVLSDCDLSYETQDELAPFNIMDHSIEYIVDKCSKNEAA